MRARPDRPFALAGVAVGGIVVGHLLAYLAAFPASTERHAHLAATGHGSFESLVGLGIAAGALAVAAIAARSLRSTGGLDRRQTALILGPLQVAGFACLEISERGFSLAAAAADPAVVLGLAIQLAVAIAVAFLLAGLVCAVRAIAARFHRRFDRGASATSAPGRSVAVRPAALFAHAPRRAPPVPLLL
jgi:hypothetical protein